MQENNDGGVTCSIVSGIWSLVASATGNGVSALDAGGSSWLLHGRLAQLGERLLCKQRAAGSIPALSILCPPQPNGGLAKWERIGLQNRHE